MAEKNKDKKDLPIEELLTVFAKFFKKKDPLKSGYKTTEFWLMVSVMLVGTVLVSGVVSENYVTKIIGGLSLLLSPISYGAYRTSIKKKLFKLIENIKSE